ncbi:hypothetical protein EKO04_003468 [Ascochyta lentis]|uniref:Uncharacterized protein n=1 Tax=Ascochyta lentis TaxID=205686 RepID=A0A8H7J706_9PLEO|nr:hypothetical protein EKO04_003468 [Ascochyta lentis]
MIPLFLTIIPLLTLPTTALPPPKAATPTPPEQWSIPLLNMHMMTRYTGLPGNQPWPDSAKFPSTIDFDINMPHYQNAHCHTTWANGTLPDDLAACNGEGGRVRFRMKEYKALGTRRLELSFILQVFRVDRLFEQQTILMGEVAITANNASEPSSYLTCLSGAPFDGLRCSVGGLMSVQKELLLQASAGDADTDTDTSAQRL